MKRRFASAAMPKGAGATNDRILCVAPKPNLQLRHPSQLGGNVNYACAAIAIVTLGLSACGGSDKEEGEGTLSGAT
jgi:hypothetical protein